MTAFMDDEQDQLSAAPDALVRGGPGEKARLREAERKARAARTLRENLARRKQQTRARRAGEADETIGLAAASSDVQKQPSDES